MQLDCPQEDDGVDFKKERKMLSPQTSSYIVDDVRNILDGIMDIDKVTQSPNNPGKKSMKEDGLPSSIEWRAIMGAVRAVLSTAYTIMQLIYGV